MNTSDPYQILGLERGASPEQVLAAYRTLAKKYHPDRNQAFQNEAAALFQQVSEAFELLNDPVRRKAFDDTVRKDAVGMEILPVAADGTGQYRRISDAIKAASQGALIRVRPGTYREGLVIDRQVEIVGDGAAEAIIIESDSASCVLSTAPSATVRGVTLRYGGGAKGSKLAAVEVGRGRIMLEDCDITSDTACCVLSHGAESSPTLRRCRVRDCTGTGIQFRDKGNGVLEDCDIVGHANTCVSVMGAGTEAVMRQCRIHGGTLGVMFTEHGKGIVEDCDIFGNTSGGVQIQNGGDPVIRRCRIHDGIFCIAVTDQGKGNVEDSEVFGASGTGVFIRHADSDPVFRRCRIRESSSGVQVIALGKGTLEDCEIYGHSDDGLMINTGGDPTLRRCKIRYGKGNGVVVRDEGKGTLEDCDIDRHAGTCVVTGANGDPILRKCRIYDGAGHGVEVRGKGKGTLEDCDIYGHASGGGVVISDAGSEAVLRRCKIRECGGGIGVTNSAKGTLEDCDIYGHSLHYCVGIESGGDPVLRRCKIHNNKHGGVGVLDKGRGTVEDCEFWDNNGEDLEVERGCNVRSSGNRSLGHQRRQPSMPFWRRADKSDLEHLPRTGQARSFLGIQVFRVTCPCGNDCTGYAPDRAVPECDLEQRGSRAPHWFAVAESKLLSEMFDGVGVVGKALGAVLKFSAETVGGSGSVYEDFACRACGSRVLHVVRKRGRSIQAMLKMRPEPVVEFAAKFYYQRRDLWEKKQQERATETG